MRWIVAVASIALVGCPKSDEIGRAERLDLSACTASSRMAAFWNCADDEFFCKRAVAEPHGCARHRDIPSGSGCTAEIWAHKVHEYLLEGINQHVAESMADEECGTWASSPVENDDVVLKCEEARSRKAWVACVAKENPGCKGFKDPSLWADCLGENRPDR